MATTVDHRAGPGWRTPLVVIVAGCLIAMVGFGVRSVFGLFLEPMTEAHGWSRETFGLALAIQNLLWGLGVPVAGALADRYGASRVLALGAVAYALGVWGMAEADSGAMLHLTGGVLTGLGVAFTAFSLALAAMAKVVGPERRSFALGLGTAAGSFGQVVFSPLGQAFINSFGWYNALLLLAASTLFIIPLAFILPKAAGGVGPQFEQTLGQAVREAVGHRGFMLLTLGFFVCGFHVAFITVHFPAYIKDLGLTGSVAAIALALIGACNIIGSFGSGAFGQRWSKKCGLAGIYFLRAIAITGLMLAPKTEWTIYLFSASMGLLWLSTVPLTTGIVGQIFGIRYMATLFGVVFLSHQLGSFSGVWLGGYLYDATGSYDPVWWAGVGFGLLAAIVHLPIDEKPLARLADARS
ncbi:MAG: MFS transporter [Tistlia sp.]|uniref:MFS transporter n=1 Tax=Tistlia sp. TaxID=3057121 RepID=UPI0034A3B29A